ncbi:MAG: hypothetical protein ABSB50_11810 [Terracidiphilus sp.]|jgi:hypothetical protein
MTTLVIDAGQSIVGIYSVEDGEYIGHRGSRISEALERVQNAEEVITYCGEIYDLKQLGRFAGIDGEFPLRGKHTDMERMIWEPLPLGSSLERTYERHFESCPDFPFGRRDSDDCDEYENSNQRDVYMTLKLWELWKDKKLDIVGYGYTHH